MILVDATDHLAVVMDGGVNETGFSVSNACPELLHVVAATLPWGGTVSCLCGYLKKLSRPAVNRAAVSEWAEVFDVRDRTLGQP